MSSRPFPRGLAPGRHATPLLVLAIGLCAAAASWWYVDEVVHAARARRFEERASEATTSLRDRMDSYVTILRATRAFLIALGHEPTQEEFAAFVATLELGLRHPGIQGVGFSKAIPRAERSAHEEAMRRAGRRGYRVWPEGERDLYTSIVYLEPLDWRNQRAIGYDMFSEPIRRAAMERARDTGEVAASGRVELVQEAGEVRQAGFLVYLPVYARPPVGPGDRAGLLRGWVYAPFRAADLLQGTLAPAQLETVGLAVYDGEDPVDGALLYDAGVPAATGEVRTERIEVAGRSWTLRYAAAEGFAGPAERILPLAVLAAGLALSVLLWWLTRREARARARAEVSARRSAFLAEAGKTLASSLAYRETLARVAELATREVADGCVVEVDDPDAPIRAAAARPGVRTRASLSVPLVARGARLGAITLSSRRRRLPREDAALAEDLARLAVAAIDTARLYWQAQDAVRERDEFLSVASHELKTPLTSLALQADSLRVSARRGQHEQVLRKVEVVRRNVERLARLVASLLDLSRIRAGRLELEIEDVDLADVAREVVERFQDEAERAGCEISLTAQGPVVGRWDPLRLDQVITNLLANAVKYGPGKPIEIRVEASRAAATVQITDHGIGIPAADLGRIFERFERAVSKRNYGGFGLGLWIVRQVVEAFGGTVRAESTPGDGATFTVELPRAVQPRPVTVVEAAPPERGPASGGEAPS